MDGDGDGGLALSADDDMSAVPVLSFIKSLNVQCGLGLTADQVAEAGQVLNDQWFSYASELECVDAKTMDYIELPPNLRMAILVFFAKSKQDAPTPIVTPVAPAAFPRYGQNSQPLVSAEKKELFAHDDQDEEQGYDNGDGDGDDDEPAYHQDNRMVREDEYKQEQEDEDEGVVVGEDDQPVERSELSLVALKKAVEHISKENASDERLLRSLQSILKKAMPGSSKVTQSVLRDYMKQLTQASANSPSKARRNSAAKASAARGGPELYDNDNNGDDDLESAIGQLAIGSEEEPADADEHDHSRSQTPVSQQLVVKAHCSGCNMPPGYCLGNPDKQTTLKCGHSFCSGCMHEYLMSLVGAKKAVGICCPAVNLSCEHEIGTGVIQALLSREEFDQYLQATLMAFIENDQLSFVCPNAKCNNVISVQPRDVSIEDAPSPMTEQNEDGRPLSKEAWVHFMQFRMRCRQCSAVFCADCKTIPYHKGHTCAQFVEYQSAAHCRFCNEQLDASNTAPDPPSPALKHVCTDEECLEKRELCCLHFKPCGCPCNGVRGEAKEDCLPCLKCELNIAEDFCAICYVESLAEAPCIQMSGSCNHVFHYACVKSKIESRWPGARVSFEFLGCPTCAQPLKHPAMAPFLAPVLALQQKVHKKARQRLEYEGKHNDPSVVNAGGEFYNDPIGYAMKSFLFYMCHDCKKPYFAGGYQCQEANAEFDPKELICPSCQPSSVNDCPIHGKEWLAYKCRYCCNIANWFCWGNTHFCDACHKSGVWQKLAVFRTGKNKKATWKYKQCPSVAVEVKAIGKDKSLTTEQKEKKCEAVLGASADKCPLRVRHPPAGFEFGLGCSMCADDDKAEDNAEAARKAQKEAQTKRVQLAESIPASGRTFKHRRDMDHNGVLYFLGTLGGKQAWCNPALAGFVKVLTSGLMADSAPASSIVGRELVRCVSKPVRNSWFQVDLQDYELAPTAYTLKHYSSWNTEALRSWVLEGSVDGVSFVPLKKHKKDSSLDRKGATKTWPLQNPGGVRYRVFRVMQTAKNSNGNHYLAVSGMELYGSLYPHKRAAQVAAPKGGSVFTYRQDMDTNGILYFLGTQRGTQPYVNPGESGIVTVTASSLARSPPSAPAHAAVGRQVVRCVTLAEPDQWFCIDLKATRVAPTHYTLRHYSSWNLEALRSWVFEGSNDGVVWELLRQHRDDHSLDQKGAARTWAIDQAAVPPGGFRMFRVLMTGRNSNNHWYLALSGFELYGTMYDAAAVSAANVAPVVGVVQQLRQREQQQHPQQQQQQQQLPYRLAGNGTVKLDYQYDFDQGGAFYYLGTRGKTQPWSNPAQDGIVTVSCSSLGNKSVPPHALCGRSLVRLVTQSKEQSWFCVDLRDKTLQPTAYTLKHYSSWDTEALRQWHLEGSNDKRQWEVLRSHYLDKALNKRGATHTWSIHGSPTAYRYFRILQTGANSNNSNYLACSGLEMYGTLHQGQGVVGGVPMDAMPVGLPMPGAVPAPVVVTPNPNPLVFKEGMKFYFNHDFDKNGIIYFLGTDMHRGPWKNPGLSGRVQVTSSALASGKDPSVPAWAITGRDTVRCVTVASRDGWFCVNLGTYWVRPTHYTLRHYSSWDTEALRDWKLQGSNDGKKWTKLMSHKKDASLHGKGATHTWQLPRIKKAYRMFRIYQTGKNSNGHWYLACSGFEIYGELFSKKP